MIRKLVRKLDAEELLMLSKFFMDVAKGILGVPLIVYLVADFSLVVNIGVFVLDLILVIIFLITAFKLGRISKRRKKNG